MQRRRVSEEVKSLGGLETIAGSNVSMVDGIYTCLLYTSVVHLHYDDISRTNMTIHVRETKGRIDRYTILSQKNLDQLSYTFNSSPVFPLPAVRDSW